MTKELKQKAVEYTDSVEEKKHWSDENDSNAVFTRKEVEQAYIDGANENGIQWHDLRKDPNDLPTGYGSVWTNKGGAYHDSDGWFDDYGRVEGVIAWCEPQFKMYEGTERECYMVVGYLDSAEPREKRIDEKNTRITELVAQIEKMKCCSNCNGILNGGIRAEKCRRCMNSKKLSEWELAND